MNGLTKNVISMVQFENIKRLTVVRFEALTSSRRVLLYFGY